MPCVEATMSNISHILFRSSTIPGLIHAVEQWIKVKEQGPPNQLWEDAAPAEAPAAAVYIDEQGEESADFVFNAQNRAEDITLVRSMGFEVNDHPLSMGGHSWKGRSGGGIASITVQCCKAQCTMDQGLQMIGPPMAFPSLESSSTASLVAHLYNEDDGNGRAATCK